MGSVEIVKAAPLATRIAEALWDSDNPDPRAVAGIVRYSLTATESERLIMEALVDRVRAEIGRERKSQTALPRRGSRIQWPPPSELSEIIGDGSFLEAAQRLGVSKDVLKRRCEAHGITDSYGRISERHEAKFAGELQEITARFAGEIRAEGIQIGLEQASIERVCIAGQWMFLADCTSEDLRTLASEYTDRAGDNVKRGAYYLAIAEQVEAGGYASVRAMCEQGSEQSSVAA